MKDHKINKLHMAIDTLQKVEQLVEDAGFDISKETGALGANLLCKIKVIKGQERFEEIEEKRKELIDSDEYKAIIE